MGSLQDYNVRSEIPEVFMDIYFIFKAVVIAIVEGITEFLPVSSTGHMIIVGDLIGFPETEFTKMFNVVIQLGAILAIVVLYFNKLMGLLISLLRGERRGIAFTKALVIGVIPAGILGVLFEDIIDKYLFKPIPVIIGLYVGAVLLIVVENRFRRKAKVHDVEDITPMQALKVGLFQCLAMWPGMSRSSSTIMGGWISGLSSSVAAEFSFFLAIPIMLGASPLKLVKFQMEFGLGSLQSTELVSFGLGFVVAFVVALICVKGFVGFVKRRPMRVFAVYRIAISIILVLLAAFKVVSF